MTGLFFAINPAIRPVVGDLLRSACNAGAWLYYDVNFRKNHIAELPEVMPSIEERNHQHSWSWDNFNAGYIYAMLQGVKEQALRIEMAQRWRQN